MHLITAHAAPAFQEGVLGPPMGAKSGGLVVSRSVAEWLTGGAQVA